MTRLGSVIPPSPRIHRRHSPPTVPAPLNPTTYAIRAHAVLPRYYVADDFKQFRAAGLSHPFMTDIERELGLQSAAATAPEPKKATP